MKQPRILSLSKDQDNSKRNKKYFDKFSDIPIIKEEKEKIFAFKKKYRQKHYYTEKNTKTYTRPKSSKKALYPKPKMRPILTKQQINKEYLNCLSLEKINFQFEEYGEYPDESFKPSIFFSNFWPINPITKRKIPKKENLPKQDLSYIYQTQ